MKHLIGKTDEFLNKKSKKVRIGKKNLLVWKSDNLYFATSEKCPHQGASLSTVELAGTMLPSDPKKLCYGLDGTVIRCPWHAWEFDVQTGKKLYENDPRCLVTYEVIVENGEVYINL
ncbi:nitrite reductase/ring-hydroxylating ferredoxin subunit [Bacillus oleivorans]|uniref:Nitrite reductase/ring-hydroxylating ferredoxin subunit n=1 Tax=Bacillus oleivorans TaxID=1448271 RepID=A0A285D789_9BACI|nr:Rieske (2Fe-2S) protein [Bacillus oleivorans]SNX75515.1 nitrite reductase/ring-hydroxylating ferredoxin subunit [Bacillus oleivorans]